MYLLEPATHIYIHTCAHENGLYDLGRLLCITAFNTIGSSAGEQVMQ